MKVVRRVVSSILEKGLTRTVQSVMSVVEDYWFEKRFGISTSEIVTLENLNDIADKSHNFWYQPTRVRHFNKLMKTLHIPKENAFVDLGSGKGRVLLIASQHDFKRVVGIEVSSKLCEVARNNVAVFEKRAGRPSRVTVRNQDALHYDVGDDENVFYLHRSFDDFILERIIERIKGSLKRQPRRIWFIFNNFQYDDLFRRERLFERTLDLKYGGADFTVYVADGA